MKTIMTVSVHRPDVNPVFGHGVTHVSIDDEAGGSFIILTQFDDNIEPGKVRLDLDELEEIIEVARELLKQEGLPLE